MLPSLPFYITAIFILTTFITLGFLVYAIRSSSAARYTYRISIFLLLWLTIQALISWKGFYYTNTASLPPKPLLLLIPTLLVIIALFVTKKGKAFVDSLPLKPLTYLHIVRIPVEMVLFWLFVHHYVPELMTFEGRNLDILSGISAPFIAYFALRHRKILFGWNVICLGLLFNIVGHAILALPIAFQQLAFDQPNIGVLYFPFSWLPSFIVPVVLFSHLVSIRRLLRSDYTSVE